MAQKTVVELTDDLDGSPASGTVTFGYEGRSYEIDLSEAHQKEMRDAFAPYTDHARTVGRTASRSMPRRRGTTSHGHSNAEVRAWAKGRGIRVSERGRIAAEVVDQYEAAH